MKNKNICSNCASWNNKQAELHYTSSRGFCTSQKLGFNTAKLENCSVFDRQNIKPSTYTGVQDFEYRDPAKHGAHDVVKSRYGFVTGEDFGCVHFQEKK